MFPIPEPTTWGHCTTEFKCKVCDMPLSKVWPSNMLVCDNPICDADPLWLVPS